MNEADTCRTYVLPKLKSAGWEDDFITEQMVLTFGRIVPIGDRHIRKEGLRPDYVLFIRHNIPIAVVMPIPPLDEQRRIVAYLDGLPPSLRFGDLRQAKVNAFPLTSFGDDVRGT